MTPEQARAIAKEAYIYGFPMVDNYRVQYAYFVDNEDPEYKGGWNEIHNTARVYTPEDKAIQTPNSDTPYSAVGADLRAEPLVLTVPPIEQDRYYSLQFVDGYTYNFAYVGSRTTGNGGGKYLLAGPNWKGDKPEGINEVIRSDTDLAFVLYRTQLFGPSDLDGVKKIQAGYQVTPLSVFLNQPPPAPAPAIDFVPPLTPDQQKTSPQFFEILELRNAVRPDAARREGSARPVRHHRDRSRRRLRRRQADPGDAIGDRGRDGRRLGGVRHVQEGEGRHRSGRRRPQLLRDGRGPEGQLPVPDGGRGARHLRQHRRRGHLSRFVQRLAGAPLTGANNYTYRFAKDQLPPVNAFWSLTMYELPQSLLVANPINRYLINSPMLPSLVPDTDGGYTLSIQNESPGRRQGSGELAARTEGPVRRGAAAVLAEARRAERHLEGTETREDLAEPPQHAAITGLDLGEGAPVLAIPSCLTTGGR